MFFLFILLFKIESYALDIIKPDYDHKDIHLTIIRAEPDSFETYRLTNSNLREIQLVCSNNRVYDNNKEPFVEYRNFYNMKAGRFALLSEKACQDLGRFIERAQFAIDAERPLRFILDRKSKKVTTVIYPEIDPLADDGDINDLFPRKKEYLKKLEKFKLNSDKL